MRFCCRLSACNLTKDTASTCFLSSEGFSTKKVISREPMERALIEPSWYMSSLIFGVVIRSSITSRISGTKQKITNARRTYFSRLITLASIRNPNDNPPPIATFYKFCTDLLPATAPSYVTSPTKANTQSTSPPDIAAKKLTSAKAECTLMSRRRWRPRKMIIAEPSPATAIAPVHTC